MGELKRLKRLKSLNRLNRLDGSQEIKKLKEVNEVKEVNALNELQELKNEELEQVCGGLLGWQTLVGPWIHSQPFDFSSQLADLNIHNELEKALHDS